METNFAKLPLQFIYQEASIKAKEGKGPLLVLLHGRGDSAQGYDWFKDWMQLPELNYLLLQAPDEYFGGYSWYGLAPNQAPGILRSRRLLGLVFDEIKAQGFLLSKTLLFGFSQGCLMTLEFGGRYAEALAGYVGISGYVYDVDALIREATPLAKSAPWLVTHGTRDEVLKIQDTRPQIEKLIQSGFNLEWHEYDKVHTLDEKIEFPFVREWIRQRILT